MRRRTVNSLLALAMLAACSGRQPSNLAAFEPVYRAASAIPANVPASTYDGLHPPFEAVRRFAIELNLVRARARTDEERRIADAYEAALVAFTDAEKVWTIRQRYGNAVALEANPIVKPLVSTYGLTPADGLINGDFSLLSIWTKAADLTATASRTYLTATAHQ